MKPADYRRRSHTRGARATRGSGLDGDALDPIGGGGALVGYGRVRPTARTSTGRYSPCARPDARRSSPTRSPARTSSARNSGSAGVNSRPTRKAGCAGPIRWNSLRIRGSAGRPWPQLLRVPDRPDASNPAVGDVEGVDRDDGVVELCYQAGLPVDRTFLQG